jgi:hypothetical protein
MFGFLLPLPWLGDRAARIAILALTAYALLPILRNTYAGIRGIDRSVLEVAHALGLTPSQRLFKVELPLAASFIFAGLRRLQSHALASPPSQPPSAQEDSASSSFEASLRWTIDWFSPEQFPQHC